MNSQRKFNLFIVVVLVIGAVSFSLYRGGKLRNKGRYTIAKATKYEPRAQGSSLFVDVYFADTVYKNVANALCPECVGNYYFVRILPDDPSGVVIFYYDKQVPDCILTKPLPEDGWKEIPECP